METNCAIVHLLLITYVFNQSVCYFTQIVTYYRLPSKIMKAKLNYYDSCSHLYSLYIVSRKMNFNFSFQMIYEIFRQNNTRIFPFLIYIE